MADYRAIVAKAKPARARVPRPASWSFAVLYVCLQAAGAADAGALPRNWPMAPGELERRLAGNDIEIREAKPAGSGVTGAWKLTIAFPDGKKLQAKWKSAPPETADGWNNSPRRELATYQIQRWLFDENDYVVPTIEPHCFALEKIRSFQADAKPTLAGSSCVLGTVAVWLEDVTAPKDAYDKKRFASDPLFARYLADLNVLTYLIGHRDGHQGNILVSTDAKNPRVYAVDNGMAFNLLPWNLNVNNWFRIRVPWVRRETVDRLRKVDKSTIRALAVVTELEVDAGGVLHIVAPEAPFEPEIEDGFARRGNRIQLGLGDHEIHEVEERVEKLLSNVDSGRQSAR